MFRRPRCRASAGTRAVAPASTSAPSNPDYANPRRTPPRSRRHRRPHQRPAHRHRRTPRRPAGRPAPRRVGTPRLVGQERRSPAQNSPGGARVGSESAAPRWGGLPGKGAGNQAGSTVRARIQRAIGTAGAGNPPHKNHGPSQQCAAAPDDRIFRRHEREVTAGRVDAKCAQVRGPLPFAAWSTALMMRSSETRRTRRSCSWRAFCGRIQRGDWKANRPISSEARLVDEFGLSRPTVRRAIAALAEEGWLFVPPQRGTYVAERAPEQPEEPAPDA
ncbi:GntR family transcriptional regulator [Streptomyces sp. NPDC058773]|uniref:GntR family transcriptional regulator n=1 Tax=Streptomyces sp. NPDC058773 TaxID=3346632 RepID=UPI0036CFD298